MSGTQSGGPYGLVPGYVASRSAVGTKTDTPIIETAQSISVISRKQIEDQSALTINQALRYTPSATTEQRGGIGATRFEQFAIRGFNAPLLLDGQVITGDIAASASIDPFRLERVDVVKGPVSTLYGQAGPGGIVNLVSKVPQFTPHGEIFLQGGSFNTVRSGIDVGGPIPGELGKEFAYRFIAGGWEADGSAVTTRVERAFVSPSLTWRPSTDTQLTIIGNYQRDPYAGFYGSLPAVGTVLPRDFGNGVVGRLPVNFYDGDHNYERSDRTQASIGYILDHRFNENLRFHSASRYLYTDGIYRSVTGFSNSRNGALSSGPLLIRTRGGTDANVGAFTSDNNLVANFDTGLFSHTALFGVDYRSLKTDKLSATSLAAPSLNMLAPDYYMNIAFPGFTSDSSITAEQTGLYLQDQIKFDRLVLTLGGRYDFARQFGPTRNLTNGSVTQQDVPAEAFTRRASLLYLFDEGVAPYVSYSEAFEPIVSGRVYDPDLGSAGRIPKPISSRQYEAGIKYQPPGTNILLSAAWFDIRRSNATSPDPNNRDFVVQTGEVGVQGVEFEARANISERLNLVGGFSFLDARNVRNTGTTTNEVTGAQVPLQGLRPTTWPNSTASLFVNYRFNEGSLNGFGIGGGVRYLGPSWGDAANTLKVGSSTLVDLVASYDMQYLHRSLKGYTVQVNIQNLLDQKYVTGCFNYASCFYGMPRTVFATLRYRW
ncbi:TonB-dependent siderophore receptor [Nitrobacter sp.]|uniref:TonB-dependent siderophore receptor n=1 Tax=Nitrobacter sp. TaxID=29420 RepID=UPI0029CAC29C|nr:TonB-dependent siderophore receptor [Nitrobacter sp.]